jgi:hypothetical protein
VKVGEYIAICNWFIAGNRFPLFTDDDLSLWVLLSNSRAYAYWRNYFNVNGIALYTSAKMGNGLIYYSIFLQPVVSSGLFYIFRYNLLCYFHFYYRGITGLISQHGVA